VLKFTVTALMLEEKDFLFLTNFVRLHSWILSVKLIKCLH